MKGKKAAISGGLRAGLDDTASAGWPRARAGGPAFAFPRPASPRDNPGSARLNSRARRGTGRILASRGGQMQKSRLFGGGVYVDAWLVRPQSAVAFHRMPELISWQIALSSETCVNSTGPETKEELLELTGKSETRVISTGSETATWEEATKALSETHVV